MKRVLRWHYVIAIIALVAMGWFATRVITSSMENEARPPLRPPDEPRD
ncbi:hypothetical protein KKHFBJBL_01768 [Brevundimonas sp. NIBR11]|nr:hypothetical protein KKHFBJBL_01768 [Brevundimonas sp. NIBR11]